MAAGIISLLRRVDLAGASAASYVLCDVGQYALECNLAFVLAVAVAIVGATITTPKAYGYAAVPCLLRLQI